MHLCFGGKKREGVYRCKRRIAFCSGWGCIVVNAVVKMNQVQSFVGIVAHRLDDARISG